MITNSKTLLVVAAHPDDEVIGCGGTLARLTAAGTVVHVAFLADGLHSRNVVVAREIEARQKSAHAACATLGVSEVVFGEFPDNQMDKISRLEIAKTVEGLVDRFQPDTILTHHAGDLNVDHRRCHEGVATACRPQPGHPVRCIASFEVSSSTEWQLPGAGHPFVPNCYVDVTKTQDQLRLALEAYSQEMRAYPHSRSVKAIMNRVALRGSNVGVEAAEAFCIERMIV